MKRMMLAAAVAGFGMLAAVGAEAMPAVPMAVDSPSVTLVAQGCGPGGHRNDYGRCRPNYGRDRGCPPRSRPDRFGRCRFF